VVRLRVARGKHLPAAVGARENEGVLIRRIAF
jgi:hypothetical protein